MNLPSASTATVARVRLDLGTFRVRGTDRASWLNGLLTCDVRALTPGQAAWGLALNRSGKIQSDVWVVAGTGQHAQELFVAVSGEQAAKLYVEFDRMLIMEDAELLDSGADFVWMALFGDGAESLGQKVATTTGGASGKLTWTTIQGAALVLPREQLQAAAAALSAAGVPQLIDAEWETFRLKHWLSAFGVDYSETDRPHEAALERRAVSWTKGCYLGQEVVCMQDMRGKVKRSLRRLRAQTQLAPSAGTPVLAAGEVIGKLTSVAPEGSDWLCLAQLKLESLETGPLQLEGVAGELSLVD